MSDWTDWNVNAVVVAVDGSQQSTDAAHAAAAEARRHNAKLYIMTVVRPPEGWWGIGASPPPADSVAKAMSRAQQEVLDPTVEALDLEDIEWESLEEYGDPADRVLQFCIDVDADLLVVGRRGAGLIERVVLGSVADRVVHYAPCPVLVVP